MNYHDYFKILKFYTFNAGKCFCGLGFKAKPINIRTGRHMQTIIRIRVDWRKYKYPHIKMNNSKNLK